MERQPIELLPENSPIEETIKYNDKILEEVDYQSNRIETFLKNNNVETETGMPLDSLIGLLTTKTLGRRSASGETCFSTELRPFAVWGDDRIEKFHTFGIPKLDFTPSFIIVYGKSTNYDSKYAISGVLYLKYENKDTFLTFRADTIVITDALGNGVSCALTIPFGDPMEMDPIILPCPTNEDAHPVNVPFKWIAFE